jgi:hypothetical protein
MSTSITLERGAVLDHYIKLMGAVDDMRHCKAFGGADEQAAALSSATADLLMFRDQHDITIQELGAWSKRNVKVAVSVKHAVQLLGAVA